MIEAWEQTCLRDVHTKDRLMERGGRRRKRGKCRQTEGVREGEGGGRGKAYHDKKRGTGKNRDREQCKKKDNQTNVGGVRKGKRYI